MAEQILAHKALQSVEVTFRLPDLIHARIDEHRPAYLWKVHPTLYLVSADGIVLGTTEVEDKPTVLVDVDGQPVEIGDQVDLSALKDGRKAVGLAAKARPDPAPLLRILPPARSSASPSERIPSGVRLARSSGGAGVQSSVCPGHARGAQRPPHAGRPAFRRSLLFSITAPNPYNPFSYSIHVQP